MKPLGLGEIKACTINSVLILTNAITPTAWLRITA